MKVVKVDELKKIAENREYVRIAAMVHRMLKDNHLYMMYMKLFYDSTLKCPYYADGSLVDISIQERKETNCNILYMLLSIIRDKMENNIPFLHQILLFPIMHYLSASNYEKFKDISYDFSNWVHELKRNDRQ